MKKRISDTMNRIIPVFNPFVTISEWFPWFEASRCTSFHQRKATLEVRARAIRERFFVGVLIMTTPENTKVSAPFEAKMGQGLMSTK